MAVVYEVNLDLHPSIADEYIAWLQGHMGKMGEKIEGLQSIELARRDATEGVAVPVDEDEQASGKLPPWVGLTVWYRIATKAALDDYIQNRSAEMRQEGIAKFGTTKYKAFRRIMDSLPAPQLGK